MLHGVKRWLHKEESDTWMVLSRVLVFLIVLYDVQEALFDEKGAFLSDDCDMMRTLYDSHYKPPHLYATWLPSIPHPDVMVVAYVILFMLGCSVLVGYCYHACMFLISTIVTYIFAINEANYLNHQYLICWILWSLTFLPASQSRSVDAWITSKKNDVFPWYSPRPTPRWARAYMQMLMCTVYLYGSAAKLNKDWLRSQPLQKWLSNPRNKWLLRESAVSYLRFEELFLKTWWYAYFVAYSGIVWDAIAPFLINSNVWPLFLAGLAGSLVFHGTNFLVFNIGAFPWLSMGTLAIHSAIPWYCDMEVHAEGETSSARTKRKRRRGGRARKLHEAFFLVATIVFITLPLRGCLYEGNVHYVHDGHMFTWRMMSRERSTAAFIDVDTGFHQFTNFNPALDGINNIPVFEHYRFGGDTDSPLCMLVAEGHACKERRVQTGTPLEHIDNYVCPANNNGAACDSKIGVSLDISINYRRYQPYIRKNTNLVNATLLEIDAAQWLMPELAMEGFHRFQYPWVFLDPRIPDNPCMPWHNSHRDLKQIALCATWWYARGGREWWHNSAMEYGQTCSLPPPASDERGDFYAYVRSFLWPIGMTDWPNRGWWWEWAHPGFNDDEDDATGIRLANYWIRRSSYVTDNSDLDHLDFELVHSASNPTVGNHRKDD